MGKIISTLALVIMIVLFPPAALITVSASAVPGDLTYPVKIKLEDAVLFLASFNPTTRALFAVAQANRRYDESAKLLSMGDDADVTLQKLVVQSNVAAGDINKMSSSNQKSQLITDLSNSIVRYDQGLAQAQEQISRSAEAGSIQVLQTPQPSVTAPGSPPQYKSSPATGPTSAPSSITQGTPRPTPQPSVRTSSPTPRSSDSLADDEVRRRQEAIEKTRRELEELRRRLEAEQNKLMQERALQQNTASASSPSPSPSPSPTPTPTQTPVPSAGAYVDKAQTYQSDKKTKYKQNSQKNEKDTQEEEDD